jgi:hypothetical protein
VMGCGMFLPAKMQLILHERNCNCTMTQSVAPGSWLPKL